MTAALALLDLDNTLVFAARRFTRADGPRVAVDSYDGRDVSFATAAAITALHGLQQRGIVVVPTTARDTAQCLRMSLLDHRPTLAIVAAGAAVLRDGEPDPEWADLVIASAAVAAPTAEVVAALGAAVRLTVREGLLIVLTHPDERSAIDAEPRIAHLAGGLGWTAERDGRRLYVSPPGVSKAQAALWVTASAGAWFAAGDSPLDLALLEAAPSAVVPAHSVLVPAVAGSTTIGVTASSGPRAAEQICDAALLALGALTTGRIG